MNKLTKIGVSALCGSLAGTLANAGELSVTGGADITWTSKEQESTGNPIGIGSNLTFAGSGELDNGWSVALTVAHTDANAYSNTNVVIGIPGLGDLRIDQGTTGTGIDRMDDKTPVVWEEAYATGLTTGIDTVSGVAGSANIEFTPEAGMLPDGLTARLAFNPKVNSTATVGDKGVGAAQAGVAGAGFDVTLEATDALTGIAGLTIFGGVSSIEQEQNAAAYNDDKDEWTLGATYAMGGFTFGYQVSEEDLGRNTGATQYDNDAYGVTFNVNDDLSIGWNHYESSQKGNSVTAEATSIQVAYTMGGATITLAEADAQNMLYTTAATGDRDATTIKLALAF